MSSSSSSSRSSSSTTGDQTPAVAQKRHPLQAPMTKGSRGPLPSSCDGCRLRRVACRGRQTDDEGKMVRSCDACMRKGIHCTTTARQTNPRVRSGRRIEAAKEIFGSTTAGTPSSPTSFRANNGPNAYNSAEAQLASDLQHQTLRLDLLELYERISGSARYPLWPASLFNFYDLLQRFKSSNQQIASLNPPDQLMLRIVAAAASRFLQPSKSSGASRDVLTAEALQLAARLADSQGVWRTVSNSNAVALLLLWQATMDGELASSGAQPYLAAAVNQIRALRDRARPERDDDSATWAIALSDAIAALEMGSAPLLPNKFRFFSRIARMTAPLADFLLPSIDLLSESLEASDPWELVRRIAPVMAVACFCVRRLAHALEDLADGDFAALRTIEAEWLEMDKIYQWVERAFALALEEASVTKPFCRGALETFTGLIAGITVVSDLVILQSAQQSCSERYGPARDFFETARMRADLGVCRYLRGVRTCDSRNYLAFFAGTFYSVSRVARLAEILAATPTWNLTLHPQGPADKLASLIFSRDTLRNIDVAYPSLANSNALDAVLVEIESLERVVDAPLAVGTSQTMPAASQIQIAAWQYDMTHNLPMPPPDSSESSSASSASSASPAAQASSSQVQLRHVHPQIVPAYVTPTYAPSFVAPMDPTQAYVACEPPLWTYHPVHVLQEHPDAAQFAPPPVSHFPNFPDNLAAYPHLARHLYPPGEQASSFSQY